MSLFLKSLRDFNRGANLADRKRLYKAHVVGELMYSTGARISEIAALTPGDLDFFRGVVRIREEKTGKIREAILNSYAEKVLRLYVERMREPVIENTSNADKTLLFGSLSMVKQFNEILNRESKLLGFGGFSSHNFRHAVGYHLLRAGCDIRFIQDILGHRDLRTTQIYTRVDKEDLRGVLDRFHPRGGSLKNPPASGTPIPLGPPLGKGEEEEVVEP